MTPQELQQRLQAVGAPQRLAHRRTVVARFGLIVTCVGLIACGWAYWQPAFAVPALVITLLAVIAVFVQTLRELRPQTSTEAAAVKSIEAKFPDLEARLLTACEQRPDSLTGKFHLLQSRLFTEVTAHAGMHDWNATVSPESLRRAWWRQFAGLAGMLIVSLGWIGLSVTTGTPERPSATTSTTDAERADFIVDPGDIQLERQQPLLVLIRFQNTPPRDVTLHWQPESGLAERMAMTKSLDDPVFAGRVPAVTVDGTYRLEFENVITPEYKVTVYELPALVRSTMTIESPEYTARAPQVFEQATTVTVIEGSTVTLACQVNQPLAQVELHDATDGTSRPLTAEATNPLGYQLRWQPDKSRRWELKLVDVAGRANRDPIELAIDVVPNRPPEIKPVFPGQDLRVSSLQELTLESRVSDDFGVLRTGLLIDIGGEEPLTVPLTDRLAGGESHPLTHLLALENYSLEPGNVVSYAYFAEDIGPDGQPRRTLGDLIFLEIRPFEESYRQMEGAGGQSGPQGNSGSPGQNLDKLIELQKQIVSSAWNIQRNRPDFQLATELTAVDAVRESQQEAQDQFEQLAETLAEAVPTDRLRTIFVSMSQAIEQFTAVEETKLAEPLAAGLQAARSAFQGLVRLRPTDHRIMQGGQSGGGAGGGGSMSQQQLNQLELDEEANRYETEKTARQSPESSLPREEMAVLNRLKDLAQRQQALNARLKDLDAELRAARTETDREELARQLRQLRDEQQDLLQDADALRNRLEQSSQPDKLADARRQLEETRPQLVDAAESLNEGKLAQALNSGTRAEKDLSRLQDDFRKQSSAQLAEAFQQLRSQARELMETEDKTAAALEQLRDRQPTSLRQRQEREQLAGEFEAQHARLEATLQAVRETVQAAEVSEPLAAKQLYDAARMAQQQKTDQALKAAAQLLQQGFIPEAAQAEEIARRGITSLQAGIESAAESILGDELADLKQAKRELAELAQALKQESQSARGDGSPTDDAEQTGTTAEQGGESGSPSAAESSSGSGDGGGAGTEGAASESGDASAGDTPAGQPRGGLRGGIKKRAKNGQPPGPGSAKPGQSEGGMSGGPGGQGGPLTGGSYGEWADRLRDVETLINDPKLQSDVAKVREQARGMRADFKRHSQAPNWDIVEENVRQPLVELQRRIAEEIARRESPDALVPTDRDPVPERYRELVRQYYERLGSGQK